MRNNYEGWAAPGTVLEHFFRAVAGGAPAVSNGYRFISGVGDIPLVFGFGYYLGAQRIGHEQHGNCGDNGKSGYQQDFFHGVLAEPATNMNDVILATISAPLLHPS